MSGADAHPSRPTGPWYHEGLAFECTQCGNCCSGPPGYVLFTEAEARAMASRLGVTVGEFLERYTDELAAPVAGRTRTLREVPTEQGYDCVFLDRASAPGRALCSIHEVRPTQCRTFPWWPEHLKSPRTWKELGRVCEGVDRGPVTPLVQIRVDLAAQRADRGERDAGV